MTFILDIKLSLTSYLESWGFLKKHNLLHFFFIPILLSLIILVSFYFLGNGIIEGIYNMVSKLFSIDSWPNWIKVIFEWFITLFIWFTSGLLIYKGLKYMILIILTPLLAILSEKIDSEVTGTEYPFDMKQLLKDVYQGIYIALRNLSIELFITCLLLTLTYFIPIISPLTTVLMLIVSWYYIGFSFLDLSNERRRVDIKSRVKDIKNKKGLAYGTGIVFNLIFMVPVLGWIFAPILATTASTLSMLAKQENKSL